VIHEITRMNSKQGIPFVRLVWGRGSCLPARLVLVCMSITDVGQSFLDTMTNKEQTLSPEVKPLGELLQYQDGSIVSRVLLKNKGGTVTLFAFDRGEGLSEHTAPFEALVLVVDGEAEVEIAGKGYRVREGETIKLPANIPHAVRASTRFKLLLTMIRA
jgi:quercetin dioxygenase-like cupin family protein